MTNEWIPISFEYKDRKLTYYLRPEQNQWILTRSRYKDKKKDKFVYTGYSYFGRLEELMHELIEEIPRRCQPESLNEIVKIQRETFKWLKEQLTYVDETTAYPPKRLCAGRNE